MTDYFAYNREDVVPTYMPGVSSYGQEGSEGNTGGKGPSVYYTTYDLSNSSELEECNEKIQLNLQLSNTVDTPLYNEEYMVGDIVIDSLSNIFVIDTVEDVVENAKNSLGILSGTDLNTASSETVGNPFKDFKVKIVTNRLRKSKYPYNSPNTGETTSLAEIGAYSNYHLMGALREESYGNWISFSITPNNAKKDTYVYTFCFVLPSGEVLSTTTSTPYAKLFVDNKYLYFCFGCGNTYIPGINEEVDDPYNTYKSMFGSDFRAIMGGKNIRSFIWKDVRSDENYVFDNHEDDFYATLLAAYYIHKECTAYVEIKNKRTGKIYRYDYGEEYVPVVNDDFESNQNTHIIPCVEPISWEVGKDSSYENSFKPFDVSIDPVTRVQTVQKSLGNFVTLQSEQYDIEHSVTSYDYEFVQHLFFIDKKGFTLPEGYEAPAEGEDITSEGVYNERCPLDYWYSKGKDKLSHIIKFQFSGLDKAGLNIEFSKFAWSDKEFPATVVYVGYPNVHIWQPGDARGNVRLPNSILTGKLDENGNEIFDENTVYDGSTGFYYMHKIYPHGYDVEDAGTAGLTNISLDLRNFASDEQQWIEIGAMMFYDYTNESHRKTITSNQELNNCPDIRRATFDELADGETVRDSDVSTYCTLFDAKRELRPIPWQEPEEGEEPEKQETTVLYGRDPDVTVFINGVVLHSDDVAETATTGEEVNVDIAEDNGLIDYQNTGMMWEPEIEKSIVL